MVLSITEAWYKLEKSLPAIGLRRQGASNFTEMCTQITWFQMRTMMHLAENPTGGSYLSALP